MLLQSYFYIESIDKKDSTFVFNLKLNPHHPVYRGHFPEQPVSPGVCTIQMVRECAEQVLAMPLLFSKIAGCKFLSLIVPDKVEGLRLTMSMKEGEDGQHLVDATVADANATYQKLKGILQPLQKK